jgi:hypothetical protein
MSGEEALRAALRSLEVNDDFTEAILLLRDGSQLRFCHRVGERWAKAVAAAETGGDAGVAERVLSHISLFRLNGKHLDILFRDGSRWEAAFGGGRPDR